MKAASLVAILAATATMVTVAVIDSINVTGSVSAGGGGKRTFWTGGGMAAALFGCNLGGGCGMEASLEWPALMR